jgi:hypothetical protein
MIPLEKLLSEATFETFFVQIIIKMKNDFNFTEIYNQIRGIRDVIVVKVIDNEKLQAASNDLYNYSLLEMKYISEGNAIETIKNIKSEALKIPGLVKFEVRTKTILKIRNY